MKWQSTRSAGVLVVTRDAESQMLRTIDAPIAAHQFHKRICGGRSNLQWQQCCILPRTTRTCPHSGNGPHDRWIAESGAVPRSSYDDGFTRLWWTHYGRRRAVNDRKYLQHSNSEENTCYNDRNNDVQRARGEHGNEDKQSENEEDKRNNK